MPPEKHYLLYARQLLRSFRTILLVFVIGYVGLGVYYATTRHDVAAGIQWWVSATFPLLLAGLLYIYGRLTYVRFTDEGVQIRQFPRSALVPYTDIEKGRVDSMEHLFDRPDRKRLQSGTVRGLYKERALCLRIRSDDGQVDALRQRLGPRTVVEREAVLPITGVDEAMTELKQRLGTRRQGVAASPGVSRRRRGRRGR